MASVISEISKASEISQRILDAVSKKSETKILKLEADIDQSTINAALTSFGLYLSRQLRMGRAVVIPKLGVITFSAPEVKLEGVTNPEQRDIRLRKPVFLINKEFVKGKSIKSGIVTAGTIRPFSMKGVVGSLGETKINYTEIGLNAGLDKDAAKISIERIIKQMSEDVKLSLNFKGKYTEMDIPNLGRLIIRNNIAAIEFDEFLVNDTLDATNKLVKEKRQKNGDSSLTQGNIEQLIRQSEEALAPGERAVEIDEGAQTWLKTHLDIDVNTLKGTIISLSRPKTASIVKYRASAMPIYTKNDIFADDRNSIKSFSKSINRPTTAFNQSKEQPKGILKVNSLESTKKKIKMWIRAKSLLSEDAYYELASYAIGPTASLETKLKIDQFKQGVNKAIGLNLNEEELESLFAHIDANREGIIQLEKWKSVFDDDRSYVNYIRDVISKYNLQTDDVLRRMELTRNSNSITPLELKESFKLLDPSLNDYKALKLSKEIMKEKQKISISELIEILGCPPDDSHEHNDWYHSQLLAIKRKVKDVSLLQKEFEKADEKNEGWLITADFKMTLLKFNVGLNLNEINRFTRYIEKDSNMMINYVKFVKTLDELKTEEELDFLTTHPEFHKIENFHIIQENLSKYLNENKIQSSQLIRKLVEKKAGIGQTNEKKLLVEDFSDFLFKICKNTLITRKGCKQFADKIDIDHDGQIDDIDIQTFLNRNGYIDKAENEAVKTNTIRNMPTNTELFPKNPLPEEKIEVVLRDLRQALNNKKISFHDFIKMIDSNEVGFITVNDFSIGIDKVMKLSQPAKDGLFAYVDKLKIGMINYGDFLKILKRSVVDKKIDVSEDNFDWQHNVLGLIKAWVKEKSLNLEDSFRIADADFDGFISKKDLDYFVRDVIKVQADEVTSPRIDRLFKLMDIFKRGRIQLSDFKRLIFDDLETSNNPVISGGKELFGRSSFDWKVHARQQIGLVISKQFPDLSNSFEEIAQHNIKLTYKHFKQWVEESQALTGFNLTDRLLQQLFADFDPHKKGYLTELDWENAFKGYNFHEQMLAEVQEALNANYCDITSSFEFFLSHEGELNQLKKEITFSGFQRAIQALIPKRFDKNEITYLWNKYAEGKLDFHKFQSIYDNKKFTGSKYITSLKVDNDLPELKGTNRLTQSMSLTRKTINPIQNNISKAQFQENVFNKLRQILHASNTSIEQFFKDVDTDGSGEVSNLEFINALRKLNLGLNLKEIEELLMYCDSNKDGKISFQEFVTKFAPRDTENRLFERSKNKLKKIKDNIYSYMLSPKDAFLTFNEDRTGKLTYSQFNKMIVKLFQLSREDPPSFSIIKDLFDFIDLRRDGIIDMNEWMQSFRLIECDTIGFDTIQSHSNIRKPHTINVKSLNKTFYASMNGVPKSQDRPRTAMNISSWECSKEYEDILKIIGKNRKLLINQFDELKKQEVAITLNKAKEIIGEVLKNHGLKVTEDQWLYLIKFSERDGIVDHKFLLEVFRERAYLLSSHPKTSIISFS